MNQRKFFEKSKIGLSTSSKKELSNFLRTVFHRKNRNLINDVPVYSVLFV